MALLLGADLVEVEDRLCESGEGGEFWSCGFWLGVALQEELIYLLAVGGEVIQLLVVKLCEDF